MRREQVQKCSSSFKPFTYPLEEFFMSGIDKTIDIESFNFFKDMLCVKHAVGFKKLKVDLQHMCKITYRRTGKFSNGTKNSFEMSITPLTKFDYRAKEMLTALGRHVLAIATPTATSPPSNSIMSESSSPASQLPLLRSPVTSPADRAMSESLVSGVW